MEYVDGRSLEEVERPKIGPLVIVFHQVASALVHMHRRGIYHGDLKPSNIMVSKAGRVKLIDFGTAWIKGQEKGRVQGTPSYMAPEQGSDRIVDDRTDIYNFGATMYRMFTGRYANPETPMTAGVDLRKLVPPIEVNERDPRHAERDDHGVPAMAARTAAGGDVRGRAPAQGRRQVHEAEVEDGPRG